MRITKKTSHKLLYISIAIFFVFLGETKASGGFFDFSCTCKPSGDNTVPWQYDQDCCTGLRRVVWMFFSIVFTFFILWFFFEM